MFGVKSFNGNPIMIINYSGLWWRIAAGIALVFLISSSINMLSLVYMQNKNLHSLGVHTFKSTGTIVVKNENRSERVNYKTTRMKTITNQYVVYISENGKYRFEELLKPENMAKSRNIKSGRSVYSLKREVWQDRLGNVEIKKPGYVVKSSKDAFFEGLATLLVLIISTFSFVLSIKKIRFYKN